MNSAAPPAQAIKSGAVHRSGTGQSMRPRGGGLTFTDSVSPRSIGALLAPSAILPVVLIVVFWVEILPLLILARARRKDEARQQFTEADAVSEGIDAAARAQGINI